jgi:hypothetical protein
VAVEVDVSLEEEEEIAVIVEVAVEAVIIDLTISNSHSRRGFLHSTHKATGTMGSSLNTEEGKEMYLQHGTVVFKKLITQTTIYDTDLQVSCAININVGAYMTKSIFSN